MRDRVVVVVADRLGVVGAQRVLDVEVDGEAPAVEGEDLVDAQVELAEGAEARAVGGAGERRVLVGDRVVERAGHGRVGIPGHVAIARAHLEPARQEVAEHHGEDVGLVELEQIPVLTRMILPFAPRQRVGEPAEEALAQVLANEDLAAVGAPDAVVGEQRIAGVLARDDQIAQVLPEEVDLGRQSRPELPFGADDVLRAVLGEDVRIAEVLRKGRWIRRLRVEPHRALERHARGELVAQRQARLGRDERPGERRRHPLVAGEGHDLQAKLRCDGEAAPEEGQRGGHERRDVVRVERQVVDGVAAARAAETAVGAQPPCAGAAHQIGDGRGRAGAVDLPAVPLEVDAAVEPQRAGDRPAAHCARRVSEGALAERGRRLAERYPQPEGGVVADRRGDRERPPAIEAVRPAEEGPVEEGVRVDSGVERIVLDPGQEAELIVRAKQEQVDHVPP